MKVGNLKTFPKKCPLLPTIVYRDLKGISGASFHTLCTVTPPAKAAFQGAVKNFTI